MFHNTLRTIACKLQKDDAPKTSQEIFEMKRSTTTKYVSIALVATKTFWLNE